MKKERPLNKAEIKLFARLYAASFIEHSCMHMAPVSDDEEERIQEEMDSMCEKLIGSHQTFSSTTKIVEYIKGLRK